MVAYPIPNFPGRTQESLLGQLLRKKLEPNVEDWVEGGRETATEAMETGDGDLKEHELLGLWDWAGMAANEQARKHTWGDDFTLEEREMGIENVDTGLRRNFEQSGEESSGDDVDEEVIEDLAPRSDEMEVVGVRRKSGAAGVEFELTKEGEHKSPEAVSSALPLDDIFRFMMTGAEPNGGAVAAGARNTGDIRLGR
ncbi:MAG: mediator of RNA polymerase II transcription subunit 8 [Pleopsidium flavum]|nr:MAG: mediator of RNA polymerase II transcription subunit 8 [Pleopsidium flavum]